MVVGKTGRHNYTEWDQVLMGAGAAHPAMNPFNMPANAECRKSYDAAMCARSLEILARVQAFRDIARIAAAHHERLDGSGYFAGSTGSDLDTPSRILAVADVAEALTAERPYRAALSAEEALAMIRPEAGRRLDAHAVAAVDRVLPGWSVSREQRDGIASLISA